MPVTKAPRSHKATTPNDLRVSIRCAENVFCVEIHPGIKINFEVHGPVPPTATQIQNFAAWAALPIGMAQHRNLFIDGIGDLETEENAARLSEVWATWLPKKFRLISVRFRSHRPLPPVQTDTDLVLFSGGVDSTFNLLKRCREGKKQALLTVHGLDYRTPDQNRFEQLIAKTDAFARQVSSTRLYVKTNIYNEYKKFGVQPDMGHGFALTAALFLWEGRFRDAEISADHSRYQEYVAYPWGTNSVTNDLFRSAGFGLRTSRNEFTRAGKVRPLATDPTALHALSFCMDYSARPHNCGVCRKCVRTKAMFLAELGSIPDIFIDRAWKSDFFKLMNFQKRGDVLVFLDIYHEAVKNGTVDSVPGLQKKFNELVEPTLMQRLRQKFRRN